MITMDAIITIVISTCISGSFNVMTVYLVTKLVIKKVDKHVFKEKPDDTEDGKWVFLPNEK